MSEDGHDSEGNIHGTVDDVVRQLLQEVMDGKMEPGQMIELVKGLVGQKTHDVSTTFRCALIAQGFEDMALKMKEIHMTITAAGAMFQYVVRGDRDDWMDSLTTEQEHAVMQASIWTLRAGNINASECPEGGAIHIDGPILPTDDDDVETMVAQFLDEIDEEFPPDPPRGNWW